MDKIGQAQKHLQKNQIEGWLLYDFNHSNPLALDFLGVGEKVHLSRRLFYWIPTEGEPVALVHKIEPYVLDHLPGKKITYQTWEQLLQELEKLLQGVTTIAMEYSPCNQLPYVSKVDAGTVEMIKKLGVDVVSSGSFLQLFTAVLNEQEQRLQREAGELLDQIAKKTFGFLSQCLKQKIALSEYELQKWVLQEFEKHELETSYDPICAFGVHTADPHYTPSSKKSALLRLDELVLLDFVAKKKGGVYGDITRMGFTSEKVPKEYEQVFTVVKEAQERGLELIKARCASKQAVLGYEVDRACREWIDRCGYGSYFTHRTGHNIDRRAVHGSGAHLDGFETQDDRPLVPGLCFTIEPGIYFPHKWGVRVEYDVLIQKDYSVIVTSGIQTKIQPL